MTTKIATSSCALRRFVPAVLIAAVCGVLAPSALRAAPAALPQEVPSETPPQGARLGEVVPDFSLPDVEGQVRTLSKYRGKNVVLEWVDPDCDFVQHLYKSGAMTAAYKKARELDSTLVWLAVNSTTPTAARNKHWIEQHKIPYPVLLDEGGRTARLLDARRAPHMFVIDKEGVLRYHGAIDDNPHGAKPREEVRNYVLGAIEQLVAGQEVAPDHKEPYGCIRKIAD